MWSTNGMPAIANGHGHLELVVADLAGVVGGLRREDIIKPRHAKTPALRQAKAEVLGMAVGCRDAARQSG